MTSSSSPRSPTDQHFGFHRDAIELLKEEWDTDFRPWPIVRQGSLLLQTVLDRKTPFYYSDGLFDIPSHPMKIFPYPTAQPIPSYSDAFADMLRVEGGDLDLVTLSSGFFAKYMLPGSEVVDKMMEYFLDHSEENFNEVVFPLNLPVYPTDDRNHHRGIGKVDLNSLIPSPFRERDRIFQVGREEWTTALVPAPAVSTMHFDHVLCGQIMPHFFGRKVWFLCPATPSNIDIWYREPEGLDADISWDRMQRMISECDDLLVWVSGDPCVMVAPPHCFHGVLTFSLGCHSGIRVASDYWMDDMAGPAAIASDKKFNTAIRKGPRLKLDQFFDKVMHDLITWGQWVMKRERPPTEREAEIIELVAAVARVQKYTLTRYFKKVEDKKKA